MADRTADKLEQYRRQLGAANARERRLRQENKDLKDDKARLVAACGLHRARIEGLASLCRDMRLVISECNMRGHAPSNRQLHHIDKRLADLLGNGKEGAG